MTSIVPGLRERQVAEVRRHLSEIALGLFDDSGYDAVSVDAISSAAGISQRTFFRYFTSKDDIILQYERQLQTRLIDALRGRPVAEGPVTALCNAFLETSTTPDLMRAQIRRRGRVLDASPALGSRAVGERIAGVDDLVDVLAQRGGRDLDPLRLRVIASAISAVATDAWRGWVRDDSNVDPADRLAEAFSVLTTGWETLDV